MNIFSKYSVITAHPTTNKEPLVLAVFNSVYDALEYAAFVTEFDEERFRDWNTYVIEGDFINV